MGYDVNPDAFANRIEQMYNDNNYKIFVAVENEKIIGFIGLHFDCHINFIKNKNLIKKDTALLK